MSKINRSGLLLGAALLLAMPLVSQARNDALKFPVADAMATPDAKTKLDDSIKLYWGSQTYPTPTGEIGEYTSNKKTNAVNKSDKEACDWSMLSALIALQDRAKKEGGNAVVDIRSIFGHDEFSSETEFECGAGSIMSGVALRGKVVKLP